MASEASNPTAAVRHHALCERSEAARLYAAPTCPTIGSCLNLIANGRYFHGSTNHYLELRSSVSHSVCLSVCPSTKQVKNEGRLAGGSRISQKTKILLLPCGTAVNFSFFAGSYRRLADLHFLQVL